MKARHSRIAWRLFEEEKKDKDSNGKSEPERWLSIRLGLLVIRSSTGITAIVMRRGRRDTVKLTVCLSVCLSVCVCVSCNFYFLFFLIFFIKTSYRS